MRSLAPPALRPPRPLAILKILLLPALLSLAGCAPSAAGTSPTSAYALSDRSIRVGPEQPFYVQAEWPFAAFDIQAQDLSSSLWVPTGFNSEGAVITPTFSLTNLTVPAGWSLELVQVKADRQTLAGRRSFDPSTTNETVTALFKVTPKVDAVAGPYSLRGDLDYRRGEAQPFRIEFSLVG